MKKIIILACFIFLSTDTLMNLNFFGTLRGEDTNKIGFKSKRIEKSATIVLKGSIKDVFPLFGPVEETKWAYGWNPVIIYPTGKKVEKKMIFKIPHKNHHSAGKEIIWIVSQYLPDKAFIEYTVFSQDLVWFIAIQCKDGGANQETIARVTYTFTGLTEEGNDLCTIKMNKIFAQNLKGWETVINYYLKTGKTYNPHDH